MFTLVVPGAGTTAENEEQRKSTSVVLITLDTTRADFLGCYGRREAHTPVLDGLAAAGTLYRHAISPAPLTLPAHASLLTGLEPPEHGLRTNGSGALALTIPTLATVLSERGYHSGAFIASRVLDRRFGLARGFDVYQDRMPAERVGQYGYPERSAGAVTDAALEWTRGLPENEPFFLWVHYYDPHAPYEAGSARPAGSLQAAYAAEIAFVDQQLGRLLAALPGSVEEHLVAAVGDHGEALGAHGEKTHGIFLYREVLEVPLILAGPGVPRGRREDNTVAIRGLAATLLRLAGAEEEAGAFAPGLGAYRTAHSAPAVYSEARLPAAAYGWAPLEALTTGRWRYIAAPRPELYDLVADPAEGKNLVLSNKEVARQFEQRLKEVKARMSAGHAAAAELDHELAAALRALGYVGGSSGPGDGIDPKDGVGILIEMDTARDMLSRGESRRAIAGLGPLVQRNPSNIPLLTKLAQAQLEAGLVDAALSTYEKAIEIDPESEFLRLNLAHALRRSGRSERAREAYAAVLEIDPRNAPAWLYLADLGRASGGAEGETKVLRSALASEPSSAAVLVRLARLELDAGRAVDADELLREAVGLADRWPQLWLVWSEIALALGQVEPALERCREATAIDPGRPEAALCLARAHQAQGNTAAARAHLRRTVVLGKDSPAGVEAAGLLESTAVKR